MNKHLVLFDLDGTITDTHGFSTNCYVTSLRRAFGLGDRPIDTDWSRYEFATASGIAAELHYQIFGPWPTQTLLDRAESEFHELVTQRLAADGTLCRMIPGAADMFQALADQPDTIVGIATGNWISIARLFLSHVDLQSFELPIASDTDRFTRELIMQLAADHAVAANDTVSSIVYVGDAVWDVRASRALNWGFVGIASDAGPVLREAGATRIVPSYDDLETFLAVLEDARNDYRPA